MKERGKTQALKVIHGSGGVEIHSAILSGNSEPKKAVESFATYEKAKEQLAFQKKALKGFYESSKVFAWALALATIVPIIDCARDSQAFPKDLQGMIGLLGIATVNGLVAWDVIRDTKKINNKIETFQDAVSLRQTPFERAYRL